MGKVVRLEFKHKEMDERARGYIDENYGNFQRSEYFIDEVIKAYIAGYNKGVKEGGVGNIESKEI